jgi:SAM-dependent methyltransferase
VGVHGGEDMRWEAVARTRWGSYITEIERRFLLRGLDLVETVGAAIEVGAEGGRWSKVLYDHGWDLTLTDVNPEAIDLCRRRFPGVNCVLVDLGDTRLPIDDASVDLLICIEVAMVIREAWFVDEATRILRHGGILIGTFQNRRSARGFWHNLRFKLRGGLDFYATSYGPWRKRLQREGFQILEQEGFCWFPFGRESNSPLIDYFTPLEQHIGLRRLPALSPWVALIARKGSAT